MKVDRTVLKSLPLFERMTDPDIDSMLEYAVPRRVAKGDAVFEQGAQAKSFFLLLHGRLKVTQVTQDGQQIIVRMVHPGDLPSFQDYAALSPGAFREALTQQRLRILLGEQQLAIGVGCRRKRYRRGGGVEHRVRGAAYAAARHSGVSRAAGSK